MDFEQLSSALCRDSAAHCERDDQLIRAIRASLDRWNDDIEEIESRREVLRKRQASEKNEDLIKQIQEETARALFELGFYEMHRIQLRGLLVALGSGGTDQYGFTVSFGLARKVVEERDPIAPVNRPVQPQDYAKPLSLGVLSQDSAKSRTLEDQPPRVVDPGRRPGRRAKYPRKEFSDEAERRCLESPPPNQATLERYMAQWCLDKLGEEPSVSWIRERVSPVFKATKSRLRSQSEVSAELV